MAETNRQQKTEPVVRHIWSRISHWLGHHKLLTGAGIAGLVVLLWGPTVYANLSTRSSRYDLDHTPIAQVPVRPVAIVFGAGVYKSGRPSPYLQWRVDTAVQLYKAHRVQKILMTGDNSTKHYNEPVVMQRLAEGEGVPAKDIVLDYAGFSTYESCYRAKTIFGVHQATLVSQGYHLPRAVTTCRGLGIQSIGIDAEHDKGRSWQVKYIVREWLSTDKMVAELAFKPLPTFLGVPEPIKI